MAYSRRRFLGVTGLALAAAGSPVAARDRTRPPNIIFLMDDQHRWDYLGKVLPGVKTPALDSLAEQGVRYGQAVCQAPMCIPSRYSIMLGLYPRQIGVLRNEVALADDKLPAVPLAEQLRRAGYQTAGFGKTHWAWRNCSTRGFETRVIGEPRGTMSDEVGMVAISDLNPEGIKRYQQETKGTGGGGEGLAGYLGCTSRVAEGDHRDGFVFEQCLTFVEGRSDSSRPLFLYLSLLAPHAPFNVLPDYEKLYTPADMPVPEEPPYGQVEPCHATQGNAIEKERVTFWSQASREQWQTMVARYRANVSWCDSLFGRVLAALKKKGVLDNCLIVYTSDHGEMLGERYYRFNKYCLFESSVRVPLIVSGTAVPPRLRGTVDSRAAELVDVLPTILTAAGVMPDARKPGCDLLAPPAKKAAYAEFNDKKNPYYMWRTRSHKLILELPCDRIASEHILSGELYDLEKDPDEWRNVFANALYADVRASMTHDLLSHVRKLQPRVQGA